MRLAYADPPYPGQARKWYRDHPDYAGEVDHAELIGRLCRDYPDGWALSTSAAALREVLILCPDDVRVAIWHVKNSEAPGAKPGWHLSWEPVIVRGGRPLSGAGRVRNLLSCGNYTGAYSDYGDHVLPGQKPTVFCQWVFRLLGAQPGDELEDLFPGSGAVGWAWKAFSAQPVMIDIPPKTGRPERIARDLRRSGAPGLWTEGGA